MKSRLTVAHSNARWMSRRALGAGCGLIALAGLLGGCAGRHAELETPPSAASIAGRYIATLGDGDASNAKGIDALTVIRLPIADSAAGVSQWETNFAQLPLANTMTGQPGVVTASADGTFGFAIGGKGATPSTWQGSGDGVVSVDLADPMGPKIGTMSMMGMRPRAIALSPSGRLLAVACDKPGAQVAIGRVENGTLRGGAAWNLADLGLSESVGAYSVAWHPSGRFIAVVLAETKSVAFFEVDEKDGGLGLAAWGGAVMLGDTDQTPAFGLFSEDGGTFVVVSQGFTGGGATPGSVATIRFERDATMRLGADGRDFAEALHSVGGRMAVGISPTGIVVCGSSVVVTSARRVGTGAAPSGIISLINLSSSGALSGTREFDAGGLPMGVSMDISKSVVIVSRVSAAASGGGDGELAFYTLKSGSGERPGDLLKADFTVGVGSMPHGAVIVR